MFERLKQLLEIKSSHEASPVFREPGKVEYFFDINGKEYIVTFFDFKRNGETVFVSFEMVDPTEDHETTSAPSVIAAVELAVTEYAKFQRPKAIVAEIDQRLESSIKVYQRIANRLVSNGLFKCGFVVSNKEIDYGIVILSNSLTREIDALFKRKKRFLPKNKIVYSGTGNCDMIEKRFLSTLEMEDTAIT